MDGRVYQTYIWGCCCKVLESMKCDRSLLLSLPPLLLCPLRYPHIGLLISYPLLLAHTASCPWSPCTHPWGGGGGGGGGREGGGFICTLANRHSLVVVHKGMPGQMPKGLPMWTCHQVVALTYEANCIGKTFENVTKFYIYFLHRVLVYRHCEKRCLQYFNARKEMAKVSLCHTPNWCLRFSLNLYTLHCFWQGLIAGKSWEKTA